MTIEDMNNWNRDLDLMYNRIAMVNRIHGHSYGWGVGAPLSMSYRLGWYRCTYFGDMLCQWRGYDAGSLSRAYAIVDALANALWLVARAGKLRS